MSILPGGCSPHKFFAFLVVQAAHLLVDTFLIFDGAKDMGRMDVLLWIPRSIGKVFDRVRLDLDVHVVDLEMVIIMLTPVTIVYRLP